MTGALVVFAKEPRPGQVKTRMCPPFSPEQAADFYGCLLDDVLEEMARVAPALGLAPVLTLHPPEAREPMTERAPAPFEVTAQRGGDLSQRMAWAVEEQVAAGRGPVLLRGSDSPALGEATLGAALAALASQDLVLCPDRDGGYNLVGLTHAVPTLFDHPMSTGSVLEDTLANARRLGLRAQVLEPGFDIDTAADLRWLEELRASGGTASCRRTLAFLDRHELWGHQHTHAHGEGRR